MSSTLFGEVSRQLSDIGWRLDSDAQGIHRHVNDSVPGALQTVAIWSMKDGEAGRRTTDTIQVEVLVRLHRLEEFVTSRLGPLCTNEMGKTVSMFLHRLIPDGRRFAQASSSRGIRPVGMPLVRR
jgi:hypothetical protein